MNFYTVMLEKVQGRFPHPLGLSYRQRRYLGSLKKLSGKDVSFVDMTAWEASPTRLSLATASPPDIYRDRRREELGVVYGLNLKVILSMVREPHHDKKLY
jgi:hypothetical protein